MKFESSFLQWAYGNVVQKQKYWEKILQTWFSVNLIQHFDSFLANWCWITVDVLDAHCVCRAQTIIDILVRHAFDNRDKFTSIQKIVIEKLWASVREQQTRRKQGKSTTGKLDVTSFERLQDQYSREHISIRRAVGNGGGRSAEQWLGWRYSKSQHQMLVYVVRSLFPLSTPWRNSTSVLSVCAYVHSAGWCQPLSCQKTGVTSPWFVEV